MFSTSIGERVTAARWTDAVRRRRASPLHQEVTDGLSAALREDKSVGAALWQELEDSVSRGETVPSVAAAKLIQRFLGAKD